MMRWTLGFVFNSDFSQVLLIHKEHPAHQKGKWNGLGGKYEKDETAEQCIVREILEESGLQTKEKDWKKVALLHGDTHTKDTTGECWEMDVLATAYSGNLIDAQTLTDEKVAWFLVGSLPKTKRNLHWLIPLCIDAVCHCEIEKVTVLYTPSDNWK